jgi:hypothetical protein
VLYDNSLRDADRPRFYISAREYQLCQPSSRLASEDT